MLRVADEQVAGHCGLRTDRVMIYWFPTFDAQYRAYPPGLNLNPHVNGRGRRPRR